MAQKSPRPEATATANRRSVRSGARRRRLFWAGSVALVAALLTYGVFATDLLGPAAGIRGPAPDIILNTADGEFHLSEQKGSVVVLYFSFPG